MRLSFVRFTGARVALGRRSGAYLETSTVRLFSALGKSHRFGCDGWSRNEAEWTAVVQTMNDPDGHRANSPAEMPASAWQDIVRRTYKRVWDDNVGLVAAGVAFYGFFALLSLLGLIVLFYGFVAEPITVVDHMRALTGVLPADVASVIGDQLMTAVRSSQQSKGVAIVIAFVVATMGAPMAQQPSSRHSTSLTRRKKSAACCAFTRWRSR